MGKGEFPFAFLLVVLPMLAATVPFNPHAWLVARVLAPPICLGLTPVAWNLLCQAMRPLEGVDDD
jgi:hypothetical protein